MKLPGRKFWRYVESNGRIPPPPRLLIIRTLSISATMGACLCWSQVGLNKAASLNTTVGLETVQWAWRVLKTPLEVKELWWLVNLHSDGCSWGTRKCEGKRRHDELSREREMDDRELGKNMAQLPTYQNFTIELLLRQIDCFRISLLTRMLLKKRETKWRAGPPSAPLSRFPEGRNCVYLPWHHPWGIVGTQ